MLAVIFALILANGFFAAAEIALIAASRGKLQQLADEGDHSARLALEMTQNPSRLLSTVQIGITLFGTLAATLAGDQLIEEIATWLANNHLGFLSDHAQGFACPTPDRGQHHDLLRAVWRTGAQATGAAPTFDDPGPFGSRGRCIISPRRAARSCGS